MSANKLTYAQLLETNSMIQQNADETYWLCATRTVQESKIFPVSAYILFSYLNCFYRYPVLLKKLEEHMSAEEIGDRARNSGIKIVAWTIPCFYLLGREMLINWGVIKPTDAVDDVIYVDDGSDDATRQVLATLAEKLAIIVLAKAGSLVPGGGLWLHTQRPEWNDANNALVGNGLSVVTLASLRRFLAFCQQARQVYHALEGPYIRSERPSLAGMVGDLGPRGLALNF